MEHRRNDIKMVRTIKTCSGENSATSFSWIHISDWHQGRSDYDRTVLLHEMLEDIKDRSSIDPMLEKLSVVIFSGDIANSGHHSEYGDVEKLLIIKIKEILGKKIPFIFCPGNHDIDRSKQSELPSEWATPIGTMSKDRIKKVSTFFYDKGKSNLIFRPFEDFFAFSKKHKCDYKDGLIHQTLFDFDNFTVSIVSINTAVCSGYFRIQSETSSEGPVWDYGNLIVSEQQIRKAIDFSRSKSTEKKNVKILVMHHPVSWMSFGEQPILDRLISENFDIVLHGHEHLQKFVSILGNYGESIFVPAGSIYDSRNPDDPLYKNTYNFGVINPSEKNGTIHFRQWVNESGKWKKDDRFWPDGKAHFVIPGDRKINIDNRRYIHRVLNQFKPYYGKRPAKSISIDVQHTPTIIDGESFILSNVKHKLSLYGGGKEKFEFNTQANIRTLNSEKAEVRDLAYKVIEMSPSPGNVKKNNSEGLYTETVEISDGEVDVIHHYRVLECEDGVWFFCIRRFTDSLTINFKKADGYDYEFLPIGGLDHKRQDTIFNGEIEITSSKGGLPDQGFIVQWYKSACKDIK